MAKGSSSLQNRKARSSKPYDASNSFVRKVASQVTNLLPQPDWITRWFSTANNQQNITSDDDDDDVVEVSQPPPNKRAKIDLNTPVAAESFRVATEAELRDRRPVFTSPSPVRHAYSDAMPGPSGLSTSARFSSSATLQSTMVSENVESKLNGDGGSDSSESTSGCSSLVPQASKQTSGETLAARRRSIDEKLSLTNHLQRPRSLFPNRVRSPRVVPPPNRRRPSFDLSYVNTSSLVERDKIPGKNMSPFYAGQTMFGGASAYRRPRENSIHDDELNLSKRGIQVRSFNEVKTVTTTTEAPASITARLIMDALEEFSSPVQDAKRMPLSVPAYRPPLGSKRRCADDGTPQSPIPSPWSGLRSGRPSQSQTVPVVAKLIKQPNKEKLQNSTEFARRIASVAAEPYSIRQIEDEGTARHQNKILKGSQIDFEMASEVNLPDVPLPITTMPTFDIVVPPATSVVTSVPSNSFKFSSPIVVISAVSNIKAQGNFTFSQPVDKSVSETKVTQNFIATCPSLVEAKDNLKKKEPKTLSKEQNNSGVFESKPASELKTGSVMDYFKSQKKEESKGDSGVSVGFGEAFKPAAGSWECETCMIRNKASSTSCVACETPRENKTASLTTSGNTWKCTSCFVMNNNSATACIACTVAKPGSEPAKKSIEPVGSAWNCVACQAVNAASSTVCKDCWCNKPPQTSSEPLWTCSSCKISNNESEDKCTSCKKNRVSTLPSSKTPSSNLKFNVTIPAESSSFQFGIDKSGLQPVSGANLGGFKFGENADKTSTMTFSFGVPSSSATQGSDKPKDSTPVTTTLGAPMPTKLNTAFSFGTNQNQFSEVSNSSAGSVKKVSPLNGADSAGSSGTGSTQKRKSESAELPAKEVISAQKRKAESSIAGKSEEKEKHNTGIPKPGMPMFNSTDTSKMATVSSSSLGTTAPVSTKTTTNSGFSFVSSSTSVDKPVATSAPTFVFGGKSSKAEEPSPGRKPASLFSVPVTTTAAVPSFRSTVTSSSGFGSTTNAPTTTSTTFMFGSGSSKSSFGTATTTANTTTNSPSTKVSFAVPATTNPSFGVPDTTTPAFGSSAAKPNSSSSSVATTSASIMFGTSSSGKSGPLIGGSTATTVPSFGSSLVTTTTAGSFSSTSASPFAGTTTTPASAFGSNSMTPGFGLTPAAKVPSFGTTPSTAPSIFGPTTTTTATPSFGSTTSTTTSVFGATTTPSIFGSTVTTTSSAFGPTITTTASIFGSTPATTTSVFGTISTAPTFGSATTTLTSSFNNTPVTTPTFGSTVTPSFGVIPQSSTPNFGNASATPTPAFGAPVTTASGFAATTPKPVGFGSNTPAPSFGIPSTNAPAFGTPSTPAFGSTPGNLNFGAPTFGTSVVTTTSVGFGTPTATPSFGTPKTESTFGTPATASGFGSGFGNTSTPAFGGFSSETAKGPAAGAFVFKGNSAPSIFGTPQSTSNNSECTPSKAPNFGFGAANTGTQNATQAGPAHGFGTFNFSGSNAAPPAFGSNSAGTNAPGSTAFGSGTTSAFGSSSGGFGSGAFNFNAGGANPQPFAFTGNQPSQNTTPGFGQVQQPQPALPTFNPNVRPTFDFTRGETPQFTAQSTAPAMPARRVKKAVRRVR